MEKLIEYNGEVHNIADWAKITGINNFTISFRLRSGWPVGQALGFEKKK